MVLVFYINEVYSLFIYFYEFLLGYSLVGGGGLVGWCCFILFFWFWGYCDCVMFLFFYFLRNNLRICNFKFKEL